MLSVINAAVYIIELIPELGKSIMDVVEPCLNIFQV